MATFQDQIDAQALLIEALRSKVTAYNANPLIYAALGASAFYGCKVTEGADDTDYIVALEGQATGDESHLNPDASLTAVRPYEFPNIASLKDGAFTAQDKTATVTDPPATGLGRYDIAYIYVGPNGAGFSIAAGTPATGVKDDFDLNGLDTDPYGIAFDPVLPLGAFPLARIYVEDDVTGIPDARIADIRVFGLSGLVTSAEYWATQAQLSAAAAAADAIATAADRVQTGLDATATAADRVQTGLDAVATAADRVQTGLDVTAAGGSATAAAGSAAAAAASYDSFDDRYLGAKASDPTLDNDGNALITGAMYWNTTSGIMKLWDGAAWQPVSYLPGAAYLPLSGGTMTGPLVLAAGSVGAPSLVFVGDTNTGVYTPGAGQWAVSIDGTDAFRIDAGRRVGMGIDPTVGSLFYIGSGLQIGGATTAYGLRVGNINVGTSVITAHGYYAQLGVAGGGAVTELSYFGAAQGTFTGSVTTQYGFRVLSTLSGATNNYGFYSAVGGATGRWNFYAAGTAANLFAGAIYGGAPAAAFYSDFWGGHNAIGAYFTGLGYIGTNGAFGWDFVGNGYRNTGGTWTSLNVNGHTGGTIISLRPDGAIYFGADATISGASPTTRMTIGNNGSIGFPGLISSAFMYLNANLTGNTNMIGIYQVGAAQSDVTGSLRYFRTNAQTAAASFVLGELTHFYAQQATIGAGSSVTTQIGFAAVSGLTGAASNYGFYGSLALNSGRYNLYMVGTADNYLAGSLGVGTTALTGYAFRVTKNITGAVTAYNSLFSGEIQSDVTAATYMLRSFPTVQNAAFTLPALYHFSAGQSTIGAAATVTTQIGFMVESTLTGAANNHGFRGEIPAGSNRFNLYMIGTADNYLAGNLGLGSLNLTQFNLRVSLNITGNASSQAVRADGVIQSGVTTSGNYFTTSASTVAASFTLANLAHYEAIQSTIGAGSAVTNQYGFIVGSSLTGATNNFAFRHDVGAAAGRWGFYGSGTADNFLAGRLLLGSSTPAATSAALDIVNQIPLLMADTVSDATQKVIRIGVRHYTNTEEPATILTYLATSANNDLVLGGGSSLLNAATLVRVLTGANNTTVTGTERSRWDGLGNFVHGTAQLADAATDGFLYFPGTTGGQPSGTPTAFSGRHPVTYNDTGKTLEVHDGTRWTHTPMKPGSVGEYSNGNAGATKTITWNNGPRQSVTLDQNTTLSFSFTGCPVGNYQLKIVQDGTGGHTISWSTDTPSTTRWLGSVGAPAHNSAASSVTFVNVYWDGTNAYGSMARVNAL